MSEPAFEEMLGIRQGECNSSTLVEVSKDCSKDSNECLKLFADDLLPVSGDGSFNLASEDEILLEHLLVELEPKHIDMVDNVLGFGAFNYRKCLSIEELSALDNGKSEPSSDKLTSSIIQQEKTTHKFVDGKSEGITDEDGTNNLHDICEDYLLDAEFEECISDFNSDPSEGYCMPNLDQDNHSIDSAQTNPIFEAKCDKNSSLLDKMTTEELLTAFKKIFSRETIVTDKQWLKNRILFGLQNLDTSNNWLISLLESHMISDNNEGEMSMSKRDELPPIPSSPLNGVFNFKTKPRGPRVRRQRHDKCDYLKTSFFEVREAASSLLDLGQKEGALLKKRGLRKPEQSHMDESVAKKLRPRRRKSSMDESIAKKLRPRRRKYEDSATFSKDKPLRRGYKRQRYQGGSRATALVHGVGNKKSFDGACSRVPFGIPLDKEEKAHEFEVCTQSRPMASFIDSDMEYYSSESEDSGSEDDCVGRTENYKRETRRHISWSLPEVLTLVEGISEYGVGRWTDIKRVFFPSSPHRSSVDLKDKWRNLLRASSKFSNSGRQAASRQKQRPHPVPQNILDRVRELALVFPYPRECKTKVKISPNVSTPVTYEISVKKHDDLLPLSMTVKSIGY